MLATGRNAFDPNTNKWEFADENTAKNLVTELISYSGFCYNCVIPYLYDPYLRTNYHDNGFPFFNILQLNKLSINHEKLLQEQEKIIEKKYFDDISKKYSMNGYSRVLQLLWEFGIPTLPTPFEGNKPNGKFLDNQLKPVITKHNYYEFKKYIWNECEYKLMQFKKEYRITDPAHVGFFMLLNITRGIEAYKQQYPTNTLDLDVFNELGYDLEKKKKIIKEIFNLPKDTYGDKLYEAAIGGFLEECKSYETMGYYTINKLLEKKDGSLKIFYGSGYDPNPDIGNPNNFLKICWAFLEESISPNNPNSAEMSRLCVTEDEKGNDITLEAIINNRTTDNHFGKLTKEEKKYARDLLMKFRKWVDSGKPANKKVELGLNIKEIDKLEQLKVAKKKTTNSVFTDSHIPHSLVRARRRFFEGRISPSPTRRGFGGEISPSPTHREFQDDLIAYLLNEEGNPELKQEEILQEQEVLLQQAKLLKQPDESVTISDLPAATISDDFPGVVTISDLPAATRVIPTSISSQLETRAPARRTSMQGEEQTATTTMEWEFIFSLRNISSAQKNIINAKLLEASEKGYAKAVKILLEEGADVDAEDTYGINALLAATSKGHYEVVKILLEKGADVNAEDTYGINALLAATSKGHYEVVKILLEKGADVNAQTKMGLNAYTIACSNNNEKIMKIIEDRGGGNRIPPESLSSQSIPPESLSSQSMLPPIRRRIIIRR